jgi:hypothetical protein
MVRVGIILAMALETSQSHSLIILIILLFVALLVTSLLGLLFCGLQRCSAIRFG